MREKDEEMQCTNAKGIKEWGHSQSAVKEMTKTEE